MSRQMMKNLAWAAIAAVVLGGVCVGAWIWVSHYGKQLTTVEAERLLRDSEFLRQTWPTRLVLYKNAVFPESNLIAEHPEVKPFLDLGLVAVRPAAQMPFIGPVG